MSLRASLSRVCASAAVAAATAAAAAAAAAAARGPSGAGSSTTWLICYDGGVPKFCEAFFFCLP